MIKQGLSYISFCPLRILYNSKFILMPKSLGTNAVVIMRVHCISIATSQLDVLRKLFCRGFSFLSVKNCQLISQKNSFSTYTH